MLSDLATLRTILRHSDVRRIAAVLGAAIVVGLIVLAIGEGIARAMPPTEGYVWANFGVGVGFDFVGKLFVGLSGMLLVLLGWGCVAEVSLQAPRSTWAREALRAAQVMAFPALVSVSWALAFGLRWTPALDAAPMLVAPPALAIVGTLLVGGWLALFSWRVRRPEPVVSTAPE